MRGLRHGVMAKKSRRMVRALTVICKRFLFRLFRARTRNNDDVGPVIVILILLVLVDEHIRFRGLGHDKQVSPYASKLASSSQARRVLEYAHHK